MSCIVYYLSAGHESHLRFWPYASDLAPEKCKGNFYKAGVKTTALVIDAAAGHLIKASATRETTKLVLDAVKTTVGKVVDKVLNTPLPKGPAKVLNMRPTMQKSSIPKSVVPRPPIVKKDKKNN